MDQDDKLGELVDVLDDMTQQRDALLAALKLLLHEVKESAIAGAADYGWPKAMAASHAAIAKAEGSHA